MSSAVEGSSSPSAPVCASEAVLVRSESLPESTPKVRGYDFNQGRDFDALFAQMKTMGFQATNLALAIDQVNEMIKWRRPAKKSTDDNDDDDVDEDEPVDNDRCTIFLGFTSNMISCGVREVIRYLVQHKMVSAIVTTAGAVEEDIMKVLNPHYIGSFELEGRALRKRGINRIGNLLVPNNNYCAFEDWFIPLVNTLHDEMDRDELKLTPSLLIERMGKRINHPDSVLYWAAKNGIPMFCPALTDGAVGDMLYFHSYKRDGFVLDIVADIRKLNDLSVRAACTGMIIAGGGLVKHHICNANLMRNGADFSVFMNTGQEFDGSDSGARPDEALSWGKIKIDGKPVKVYGENSINFPLLVSQTFAKHADLAARKTTI